MPVMEDDRIVGIITSSDIQRFSDALEQTKAKAAMTEPVITINTNATLEQASRLMVSRKIGSLPVVEDGNVLVGIITVTDLLTEFLDVMGASEASSFRIDLLLGREPHTFARASQTIANHHGEILSLGTYRQQWEDSPVHYVRVRNVKPEEVTPALKALGYNVLGVRE